MRPWNKMYFITKKSLQGKLLLQLAYSKVMLKTDTQAEIAVAGRRLSFCSKLVLDYVISLN